MALSSADMTPNVHGSFAFSKRSVSCGAPSHGKQCLRMGKLPFEAVERWRVALKLRPSQAARQMNVSSQQYNVWRARGNVSADESDRIAKLIADSAPKGTDEQNVDKKRSNPHWVAMEWPGKEPLTNAQLALWRAVLMHLEDLPTRGAEVLADLLVDYSLMSQTSGYAETARAQMHLERSFAKQKHEDIQPPP